MPVVAAETPNIILIYTDDQGCGDVSCLNPDSKFQTPNLDRLATEGMRFTDAHAGGSVCVPSRYALLTGRFAVRETMNVHRNAVIQEGTRTVAAPPTAP